MTWLRLAVDSLATYRIARLVTEDAILDDLREWIWKHHSPEDTKIGYFVTCPYCVSVWAAGAIALSYTPRSGVVSGTFSMIRQTLAVSGAVALAHEVLNRTG